MPGLCVWSHVASTVLLSCLCRRKGAGWIYSYQVIGGWSSPTKMASSTRTLKDYLRSEHEEFSSFRCFSMGQSVFLVSWWVATLFAMNRYQLSRRMCHGHLKMCRSWRQVRTAPRKCLAEKPENGVACVAPKSTGFMRFYGRWSEYIRISLC